MGSFEISRAGIYRKYYEETVLFPVYTTRQRNFALYVTGVIFTCKYFKFGLNTTGLSQSHFRNLSACSIKYRISFSISKTNAIFYQRFQTLRKPRGATDHFCFFVAFLLFNFWFLTLVLFLPILIFVFYFLLFLFGLSFLFFLLPILDFVFHFVFFILCFLTFIFWFFILFSYFQKMDNKKMKNKNQYNKMKNKNQKMKDKNQKMKSKNQKIGPLSGHVLTGNDCSIKHKI